MSFFRLFINRLYARIWLAVVLALATLSLLSYWAVRLTQEPPPRDVVIRSEQGVVLGQGKVRITNNGKNALITADRPLQIESGLPKSSNNAKTQNPTDSVKDTELNASLAEHDQAMPPGQFGPGPEFLVQLKDGQILHIHLPFPKRHQRILPFGFFWSLGLAALAVALATYPIIRRLTRRLEALTKGVESWGEGQLSTRVSEDGSDEIAFLGQRFNHAASQIESLVMAHKTLLANASHELRTPLTRIRMSVELMGDAQKAMLMQEIKTSIGELDQLIDEILLASRLDTPAVNIGAVENIDLTGLASEECSRSDVTLELGSNPQSIEFMGVPRLIRRLIRNLVDNAIRHSGQKDGVEVHLKDLQNGFVQISVYDKGPGVPAAQQDRIFEPFFRLAGYDENDKGAGLGLSLVRSIAERHSGSVHYQARPEGGSIFVVSLPKGQLSPPAPSPAELSPKS